MLRMIGSLSFIWLLMAISTAAQTQLPPVLDADGQPLRSGVEYYVLPGVTDVAGGLTLVDRNGSCPLYVGFAPIGSRGIPVVFTPRVRDTIIRESRDFTVEFSGDSICVQSTAWMVGEENPETARRYIVTGTEPRPPSTLWYFNIVNNGGVYSLNWCPECLTTNCPRPRCGAAGLVDENGKSLLVLDGPAFPFIFRRAN
uniref:Uncharacterized protein n=1 Tax=Salix viminalis TaxID=40686 RepID=A0A6N2L2F7_SALVM